MRHLRRHADGFPKGRMRVNRLANIHRICAHLNRQSDLAKHVARMRADHAASEDLAVAVGFISVIKQHLGDAFIAAIGHGAARCRPGEQALGYLNALDFGLVFCGPTMPAHGAVALAGEFHLVDSQDRAALDSRR